MFTEFRFSVFFFRYLYWVSPRTTTMRGGLFKLDIISHELMAHNRPQMVMEGDSLGPFTIDVMNYRILVVHKGRNTVLAVSLDG
jgi:hypothetical protein